MLNEVGLYESSGKKVEFLRKYMDFNKFLSNFKKVKKENACEVIFDFLVEL